jgi:hypothetical protein
MQRELFYCSFTQGKQLSLPKDLKDELGILLERQACTVKLVAMGRCKDLSHTASNDCQGTSLYGAVC